MTDLYPQESFTAQEAQALTPHVTNLDSPVFALTALPETTKGMLFARYSRYAGTLRRLLLDEFSDSLSAGGETVQGEGRHAADVAGRVIAQFGDDSVLQLSGVHVACEWSSNILTKILQRPRIGVGYLEQSTRYIAFDQPVPGTGRYRYFRHQALGPGYEADMDLLFGTYSRLVERMTAWNAERFARGADESEAAWRRAIRAKAFDACRGLLPAASLSHMGIYASGQAYEQLILHLLAHPLPEARDYGARLHAELQKVIPSFLSRIERPDRGGEWVTYLQRRREASLQVARRLGLTGPSESAPQGASVTLLDHHGDERRLLAALIFEQHGLSDADACAAARRLGDADAGELLAMLMGQRGNRRHRPGRGLERLSYRFEIVSDYGAFRDLQRHRMLTCQWQQLTPDLGASVPEEIIAAGLADEYQAALEVSADRYRKLHAQAGPEAASYALCLAYRLRYMLELNAREAMQLIELRSGREGHPSYRAVALEMHRQIAEVHPAVAAAMVHVDHSTDERLERLSAELRNEARSAGR